MHSIILAVTSAVMYLAMGASANPEPQVHVNIPQSIVNNPNKPKFLFFPSQSLTPELRRQQAITNWQEQNRLACLARCKRSAEGEDNQVIIRAKRSSRVKRQCGCGSSCGNSCNSGGYSAISICTNNNNNNNCCCSNNNNNCCCCNSGSSCGCSSNSCCCNDNNNNQPIIILVPNSSNNNDCCCGSSNNCCCSSCCC